MIGRDALDAKAREVGELIGSALPPGAGFALLLFDYGEGGFISWISSAQRESMITAMRALLARWEAGAGDDDRRS